MRTISNASSHRTFLILHLPPPKTRAACPRTNADLINVPASMTAPPATSTLMELPRVGFGTGNSSVDPSVVGSAVKRALGVGFRHLDCASLYKNQRSVGDAINGCGFASGPSRATLWVTSKLWVTDFAPEHVEPACRHTLKELQVCPCLVHSRVHCTTLRSNCGLAFRYIHTSLPSHTFKCSNLFCTTRHLRKQSAHDDAARVSGPLSAACARWIGAHWNPVFRQHTS